MNKAMVLDKLIKEMGYNLKTFATKCGIPYTTLYGIIKNGVGRASMDNILIICKNLGITVEQLEEMASGIAVEKTEPTYDELITVYTRSRNNLSKEEKMRLARIILSDDED